MSLDAKLQSIWYHTSAVAWLLLPLSWLFGGVVLIRRWLFRHNWFSVTKVDKPVIVIGNISVGGTGKTPLVIWLARILTSQGYRVAVIARGYRGKATVWPQTVTSDSDPLMVGDEPVLIAQQTDVIVIAGPNRVASARRAIELGADVVISDDGLQHYRLHRDCEIAVIDGVRRVGNGYLLPAGPLREPPSRLKEVDLVLINRRTGISGSPIWDGNAEYRVELRNIRSIKTGEIRQLDNLAGQQVHAVTGIGHPQSFISALQVRGLKVLARILPDHADISLSDIQFGDALPVLMTAKDAVKCRRHMDHHGLEDRYWAVDAEALLEDAVTATVLSCIQARIKNFAFKS